MSDFVRIHIVIKGRVQGVGFRFFAKEQAQKLGLTGWVRNTFDGNVEAIAEGSKNSIDIWISHLQTGPRSAFVTTIKKDWLEAKGMFKSFQIAPTN
jgi:acylphosphatase